MSVGSDAANPDRRLRLQDLFQLRLPVDLALAPDGRTAAVVVEQHLKKADRAIRNLWRVDLESGETTRLTRSPGREGSPSFSPDGTQLGFLAERPLDMELSERWPEAPAAKEHDGHKEPEPRTQVWCLDLARGGEPRQLTRFEEGVEAFAWAPDGRRIVVAARTPEPEQRRHLAALRDGKEPHVLDRTQHKWDGVGFLDDVQRHLHVVDLETGTASQITTGPCSETAPAWSPDGAWIAFRSNRTGDADNNHREDLWLVRPDGSEVRRLTRGDLALGRPVWSPDSRAVAATGSLEPEDSYALDHILVVDLKDALPVENLATCVGEGWSEIGGVVPDAFTGDPVDNARRYPKAIGTTPCRVPTRGLDRVVVGDPCFLSAGRLVALVGDRGQTRLVVAEPAVEKSARLAQPNDRGESLEALAVAGGRLGMIVASPERGHEVHVLTAADVGRDGVAARPVTAFFAALRAERDLRPYARLSFADTDGVAVESLVVLPPGFDPAEPRPMPLLASIHGGPMAYDSPRFRFEKQYWASQGYLVVMVNYRGSVSYGEAFTRSIRGDWGPREHDDLMSAIDHLIALGWADPERLFTTGFSYGGIMTNWAVGHTDRFRAAVSEHGLWDYAAAFGTDDCHLWWQDDIGVPWQNRETYRRMSPSSGAAAVRTPTLIMAGGEDWRCPLDQSELMYMTLKKRGVETRLVVYPGEHHSVTKPSRALDRLRRIGAWLEAHGGLPMIGSDAALEPDTGGGPSV